MEALMVRQMSDNELCVVSMKVAVAVHSRRQLSHAIVNLATASLRVVLFV